MKPDARTKQIKQDCKNTPEYKKMHKEYFKKGMDHQTKRCEAICMSEDANGRKKQALHIATKTNMSVEEALTLLRMSPAAQEEIPINNQTADQQFLSKFYH
ncbi:MAG: hypothetical protein QM504_15375 [Pseudomonadota bacterium]